MARNTSKGSDEKIQTLESLVTKLNTLAFFKEFSFSKNRFTPLPGKELEFADSVVWLEEHLIILQMKERVAKVSADVDAERKWFRDKALRDATKQVRDSLKFLDQNEFVRIENERGHSFEISRAKIQSNLKIVVYSAAPNLPEDCRQVRGYISRTAGFIHVLSSTDYINILDILRVPADIREYFSYRGSLLTKQNKVVSSSFEEPMIMGEYLSGNLERAPSKKSLRYLREFEIHADDFDLSGLIGNLHDHIKRGDQPYEYYRIMLEFAKAPRSLWREVKARFLKCMEAVSKGEFARPFRLAFPGTNCTFMLCPVDPNIVADSRWGEDMRINAVQNLTYAAKYDMKTEKCVGLCIAKEGEFFLIDWCLLDFPFQENLEFEKKLVENYPFREAKPKMINKFFPN